MYLPCWSRSPEETTVQFACGLPIFPCRHDPLYKQIWRNKGRMWYSYYFCNLLYLNDKNLFHFSIYRFVSFFLEAKHCTGCARHNLLGLSPIYGHVVFPVCCYYNKQCHNEQSQINNFADVGQHFGREIPRSGISGLSSGNIYLNKYGHSSAPVGCNIYM